MKKMFPGAILGLLLIIGTSSAARADFWDVTCWFVPQLPWCPEPVKDPPPRPKVLVPDVPGGCSCDQSCSR